MDDKTVNTCQSLSDCIPGLYVAQELSQSCFQRSYMLKHCRDKFRTQETCDKVLVLVY